MSHSPELHHVRRWLLMAALLGRGGELRADDPPAQSPTAEERAAVAALADAGGLLTINGEYQVVSVLLLNADGVKDDTLVHLQHLPHLETVSIAADNLTDAALKHLEALKHVRQLTLRNSQFSADGFEKLQAALPECRVGLSRTGRGFAGFGGAQGGPRDPEAARAAFEAARAAAQQGAGANAPGAPADLAAAQAAFNQRGAAQRGGFGGAPWLTAAPATSGRGFGTRSIPSPLLQELLNVDVQVELQITSEQWQLVQTMYIDAGTAQQELVDKIRAAAQAPDSDAGLEPGEGVRTAVEELRAAADERLKGLLTAEQFQRLQQLAWQTAGPRELFDAPFAVDLELSDAQRAQLESVRTEQREFLQQLAQGPRRTRETTPSTIELFGDHFWNERLLSVLTDEQRAVYERKLGPPREATDEQQLGQHAFALLDTNGDEQIDDAEWQSEDAERILSMLAPRGIAPLPLSRAEFVRMYVSARHRSTRFTRSSSF